MRGSPSSAPNSPVEPRSRLPGLRDDQRQPPDLGRGRRARAGRDLGPGRDDEHPRHVQQLADRERTGLQRQVGEGQVDAALAHEVEQRSVGGRLAGGDAHAGLALAEGHERRREDPRRHAREEPDAHVSGPAALQIADVGLGRLDAREDVLRMAEQQLAGLGQLDRLGTLRALDQPLSGQVLEERDLPADRRLHVPEPVRAAAERSFMGHCRQRRKVTQLNAQPAISTHRDPPFSRCPTEADLTRDKPALHMRFADFDIGKVLIGPTVQSVDPEQFACGHIHDLRWPSAPRVPQSPGCA